MGFLRIKGLLIVYAKLRLVYHEAQKQHIKRKALAKADIA